MDTMNIDDREGLIVHIEGLQATLTKRNKRIEELEQQLASAENGELAKTALKRAYKDGWEACSGELAEATRIGAVALGNIRRDAFDIMMRAARGGFNE